MYVWKFTDIGEGIHEGKIAELKFKQGDKINDGDTLFTVETDKMNAEMPAPATGTIVKLNISVGQTIHVGDVICEIDDGATDAQAAQSAPASEGTATVKPATKESNEPVEEAGASVVGEVKVSNEVKSFGGEIPVKPMDANSQPAPKSKVLATPSARSLAARLGVNINKIKGSGYNGRVMKSDIEAAQPNKETSFVDSSNKHSVQSIVESDVSQSFSEQERTKTIDMSTMRKAIARNMSLSKDNIPHAYISHEVDMTKIWNDRKSIKDLVLKNHGVKITFMHYLIKAIAMSLKEFPIMNSSVDMKSFKITMKNYVNVGFAADTPAGLFVPVVKDADKKSIIEIAYDVSVLGKKAIEGKLSAKDMSDGTFTLSNFGSVGAVSGFSIIKPGEVGIMGMGGIKKTPVFDKEDNVIAKYILNLSTSMDHRIIDGATAARFANKVKQLLENPAMLTVL